MKCQDVLELLDSYLSDELLAETNHGIMRHLETCSRCRAEHDARRELRDALRGAYGRATDLQPAPRFLNGLRETLKESVAAPPRRWSSPSGLMTLAASVALAVFVGGALWEREWIVMVGELARAAVGDHRDCALDFRLADPPVTLAEAARRYNAVYRDFETAPSDDIASAAGTAHVLERHVCVYQGRRFVHVVLSFQGERLSLLVPGVETGIPRVFRTGRDTGPTPVGRVDGMAVASWRNSGQLMFLVGNVEPNQLMTLARALASSQPAERAGA
jgi:hypothetical protein